jgi:hypothetical protein
LTEAAFVGLLYSVYYAAVVSVIDEQSAPGLDERFDAIKLANTFKKEVSTRLLSVDRNMATPPIQLLQGIVLALVSNWFPYAHLEADHLARPSSLSPLTFENNGPCLLWPLQLLEN